MINFSVEVYADEPFEKALRRSRSRQKTGLLRDLKETLLHQAFGAEEDRQAEEHPPPEKALRLAEFPMADRKEKRQQQTARRADRKPVGR